MQQRQVHNEVYSRRVMFSFLFLVFYVFLPSGAIKLGNKTSQKLSDRQTENKRKRNGFTAVRQS